MVSPQSVEQQLKKLHFNGHAWGKAEVKVLPDVILPDEEIYECVNGIYEGGFALLVATNIRVLLIDKKPLNYLTIEDLRFDMITEIDYSHRLMGARININAGNKNLKFNSYNQPRLRKLINHVQKCIAEIKKQQNDHQVDQKQHLEQINQQLQSYLLAQYNQQMMIQERLQKAQAEGVALSAVNVDPVRPAPELSDYLYAQSLINQHQQQTGVKLPITIQPLPNQPVLTNLVAASDPGQSKETQLAELYAEGYQEVFGKTNAPPLEQAVRRETPVVSPEADKTTNSRPALEVNSLRIAYSKLPMALRNRKFGRPSFHAHSQARSAGVSSP